MEVTKEEEHAKKIEEVTKLLEDDWGYLDFTPTFMGKYKIINKEFDKGKEKVVMSTKNSKVSTSTTLDEKNYTKNFDEVYYEQPTNPKEMKKIYGIGYNMNL